MRVLVSTSRCSNGRKLDWRITFNDKGRDRLIKRLFEDWFELPVETRRTELKGVCRYAAAHPTLLTKAVYYDHFNYTANAISELVAWAARCQNQTEVNTRVNKILWTDIRYHENLYVSGPNWLLVAPPRPRKEIAVEKAARVARKKEYSDNGFRDYVTEHIVSIHLDGHEIARTGCNQVGACARAHGKTWWQISDKEAWKRMLQSSAWPTFVTEPETCTTYMEII